MLQSLFRNLGTIPEKGAIEGFIRKNNNNKTRRVQNMNSLGDSTCRFCY